MDLCTMNDFFECSSDRCIRRFILYFEAGAISICRPGNAAGSNTENAEFPSNFCLLVYIFLV
jgi:hypothetical protein